MNSQVPQTLHLPSETTVEQAKEIVEQKRHEKNGVFCPVCSQQATTYSRQVTSTMAYGLMLLYHFAQANNDAWLNVPEYFRKNAVGTLGQGGDWAKLAHWGLIEKKKGYREDESNRLGLARITAKGKRFCEKSETIPKYAYMYDNEVLSYGLDTVDIVQVLGKKFQYRELFESMP